MLAPKRSQIQNVVRNARQKEKLDEMTLVKNLKLKSSGDKFFQKYTIFLLLFNFMVINPENKYIMFEYIR